MSDAAYEPRNWQLIEAGGRLELQCTQAGGPGAVFVDFVGGAMGYSRRVPGERLLFRAIGPVSKSPFVIDATAGLGRDAFVLACHGHRVVAIERSPTIAALLEDGLRRAMQSAEVRAALGDRLRLVSGDARQVLRDWPAHDAPDVIYLDPMFPPRRKSALVKKEAIALRDVVGADDDAGELLDLARRIARRHVVVKRMRHAPPIAAGVARTYEGTSIRFDVHAPVRPGDPPLQ